MYDLLKVTFYSIYQCGLKVDTLKKWISRHKNKLDFGLSLSQIQQELTAYPVGLCGGGMFTLDYSLVISVSNDMLI